VSVLSVRIDGPDTWWKLQGWFNSSIAADEFTTHNDSVFSLQHTQTVAGLAPILSLEYIAPPSNDTLFFLSLFDGDVLLRKAVTRMNGPYSGPTGTYADCTVYSYEVFPAHYREIVKPGIGVVVFEIFADSSINGPAWYQKSELTTYILE